MNPLALFAGLVGFFAVALGAFGAHGLDGRLSAQAHGWWETATFYALTHAVAALALSLNNLAPLRRAGWAFVLGAIVFGGSLYAMALGAPRWFGMITPLGGLSFLAGWALVIMTGLRKR